MHPEREPALSSIGADASRRKSAGKNRENCKRTISGRGDVVETGNRTTRSENGGTIENALMARCEIVISAR